MNQVVHKQLTSKKTACGKPITKNINYAYWNSNVTCKACKKAIKANK